MFFVKNKENVSNAVDLERIEYLEKELAFYKSALDFSQEEMVLIVDRDKQVVYKNKDELPKVLNGLGIVIISG